MTLTEEERVAMFRVKIMFVVFVLIFLSGCGQKMEISGKSGKEEKEVTGYYVTVGGKEYGPVDLDTLKKWIQEGRIAPTTIIRQGNKHGWARDIRELKGF